MIIRKHVDENVHDNVLNVTAITLLSIEEYKAAREYIPLIEGWWWLRSPGGNNNFAAIVLHDGWVRTYGNSVLRTDGAVRPALIISNLVSFDLKPGDRLIDYAGYDWTVIYENMALCDTSVGSCYFRKDWKAPDANDYNKSDVKKWLENWAKERGIIC